MKEEDIGLYKRLIAVLNHFGCDKNTSSFAKSLGVNSQNISNIYNRKTIPKVNLIAKIATLYPDEVNYHWLLTGEGDMKFYLGKKDILGEELVVYKNQLEVKYTNSLERLQEKDQKIIELQDELNELNKKLIKLLEQKIEE